MSPQIDDVEQLEHLSTCPLLMELNLDGNPLSSIKQYRRIVVSRVPQVETLDDVDVTAAEKTPVRSTQCKLVLEWSAPHLGCLLLLLLSLLTLCVRVRCMCVSLHS